MCYDRRRAEACVDESAHHALATAGGREIVGKKEGEQKGSARGSVHWTKRFAPKKGGKEKRGKRKKGGSSQEDTYSHGAKRVGVGE